MSNFEILRIPFESMEIEENVPLLAQYFPNIFAEALMPINPARWTAFFAGSVTTSEMAEVRDRVRTPLRKSFVVDE